MTCTTFCTSIYLHIYIYIRVHVELSTLHSMVATRFPGSNISVIATSRLVTDVFPNVRVKRVGKKKVSILVSIELRHQPSLPFSSPFPRHGRFSSLPWHVELSVRGH